QLDLTSENNVERLVKANAAVPILRFGPATSSKYADIRPAEAVAETDTEKLVVASISNMTRLGRIIVASPGMPVDDLEAMRAAYLIMVEDADFLAAASEQGVEIDPLSGQETKAIIQELLNSENAVSGLIRSVIE
ncbi:MAG: hypothetical protein ACR2O1_17105, partial [Boseongicola sp.]